MTKIEHGWNAMQNTVSQNAMQKYIWCIGLDQHTKMSLISYQSHPIDSNTNTHIDRRTAKLDSIKTNNILERSVSERWAHNCRLTSLPHTLSTPITLYLIYGTITTCRQSIQLQKIAVAMMTVIIIIISDGGNLQQSRAVQEIHSVINAWRTTQQTYVHNWNK